jgi:hypothetical protein
MEGAINGGEANFFALIEQLSVNFFGTEVMPQGRRLKQIQNLLALAGKPKPFFIENGFE